MSQRWHLPAVLGLLAAATLVPFGSAPPRFDASFDLADAIANIALFLPLGVVLERQRWGTKQVVLLALTASIGIEVAQGFLIPGRRGSVLDVIFNLGGALAGLAWRRTPTAVLALPLLPWLASGALLRPAAPRTPVWWGQWAHTFEGTVPFAGRILSLRLLGFPVPDGPIDSTARLISEAQRAGLTLDVELVARRPAAGPTHLAGVSDGEGHTIVALQQRGNDLMLTWRSRGAALGLRPPTALFPAVLPVDAGERVELRAEVRNGSAGVTVEAPELSERRSLRFTPMAGWRSFVAIPSPRPGWQGFLTALWTALGVGYAALITSVALRRRTAPLS